MMKISEKNICIPITFNNPLKECFLYKKYLITIQTRPTQIVKVYFLLRNGFNEFLKIVGAQNQLPITFCSDLMRNKTVKSKSSTPTHTNF